MKKQESITQQACITVFKLQYPKLWADKKLFSIPNGGNRDAWTGANMKREGQMAGVWDLFLSIPIGCKGGLYIEVKAGKNGLTKEQADFKVSHEVNYSFAVCYCVDQFLIAIKEYLNAKPGMTPELIVNALNNVEWDSEGNPLYSYCQVIEAINESSKIK